MIDYINRSASFDFEDNLDQGLGFYEFTLEELGLPTADELLDKVLAVKRKIGGLEGWKKNGISSSFYKGFSLTYNSSYIYPEQSIYGQTFGDYNLTQSFSKNVSIAQVKQIKNSYYDTLAFRHISDVIEQNLGSFLNLFSLDISRSRCAFLLGSDDTTADKINYHIDEYPIHLLRFNIPLQTSKEYVLEINGSDEFNNSMSIIKHLEKGKLYIWNTRIPHKVYSKVGFVQEPERIHLVLGMMPWLKYVENYSALMPNCYYGLTLKKIIENKLFLKSGVFNKFI